MGHWGGGKGSCLHSYSWASIGTSLRCQCHSLWGERKEGERDGNRCERGGGREEGGEGGGRREGRGEGGEGSEREEERKG